MALVFLAPEHKSLFAKKEPPLAKLAPIADLFLFLSLTAFSMFFGFFGLAFAAIAFMHPADPHTPAGLAVAFVCTCISKGSDSVASKAATNFTKM